MSNLNGSLYTGYCSVCKRKILHKKKATLHSFGPVMFFYGDYEEKIGESWDEWWCEKCHKKFIKKINGVEK